MRRRDLLKAMTTPLFAPLLALVPKRAPAYGHTRLHEQDVRGIIAGPATIDVDEMSHALTNLSSEQPLPWSEPGADPIADVRSAIQSIYDQPAELPVVTDPSEWLTLEYMEARLKD